MISAWVQHHPSRADLIPDLTDALEPLPVHVIEHFSSPPDPWGGYQRTLRAFLASEEPHGLVIQDDAQPCEGLPQVLPRMAAPYPVCLFMGAAPMAAATRARRALMKGECYIPLGPASFMPLVAVLWPRKKAEEFLTWADGIAGLTRADDGNAAKWMKRTKQQVMVTVPSVVEHNDYVQSVKGGRPHKPRKESWRYALLLAEDARNYEW